VEGKIQTLNAELVASEETINRLNEDLDRVRQVKVDIIDQHKKLLTAVSDHCSEQRRLLKVLQKEHGFQTKFDINYEYRSTLEKVIIGMFEHIESCSNATNI